MTKQNKEQTKEKIKTSLNEKLKLDFKEFENENFYFCYLAWARKEGSKMRSKIMPIQIGYLKQLHQSQECILRGWGWPVDLSHHKVKTVMDSPQL